MISKLSTILLTAYVASVIAEFELDPCTACTFDYRPVCGSNGKDYAHKCILECERKTSPELTYTNGPCVKKDACKVTLEYKPVCGSDRKEYPNLSSFECERISNPDMTYTEGSCKDELPQPQKDCTRIPCVRKLEPVCASNGQSYNNECLMRCEDEKLSVVSMGRCSTDSQHRIITK